MSNTNKQTIDVTPLWKDVANILILSLESDNEEGKKIARSELRRMGQLLDTSVNIKKSGILANNVIHIAQIYGGTLHNDLLHWLKHKASFKDTDKTLNEFIVPVSSLVHGVENFARYKDKTAYDQIYSLWINFKDANIQYLHITFA